MYILLHDNFINQNACFLEDVLDKLCLRFDISVCISVVDNFKENTAEVPN